MRGKAFLLGLGAAGCALIGALQHGCASDPAPTPPLERVVVGATAPLTGAQESLGPAVQQMLQLAESQVSSRGGILGRSVHLELRDDGSDPATTVKVATELLAPPIGAIALIGPSTSSEALAILDLVRDAGRPMISPLALSPQLTSSEPPLQRFFFRTESSAVFQARAMAKFLRAPTAASDAGAPPAACSKLAIFHYDDLSGVGNPVAAELKSKFEAAGGQVVLDAKIDPNAATYRPEIDRLLTSNAECQVVLMLANQGALFLRELRAATAGDTSRDWSAFITMGSISFYTAGFIASGRTDPTNASLPSAAEGIYGTALDLAPDTPEYSALFNVYKTQFPPAGDASTSVALPTSVYDAVLLLALAAEQAGSLDGVKIRDALFAVSKGGTPFGPLDYAEAVDAIHRGIDINYEGASGHCDFDDSGDVLQDEIVWRVQGGAFQTALKLTAQSLE
jgi:ABC-type branched-subunit amino acid transport system substrate-binding protein